MESSAAAAGFWGAQLILFAIVGLIYAIIVYVIARKRGINPWGWIVGVIIPGIGSIVFAVFSLLTLLSVLDRLNALEKEGRF